MLCGKRFVISGLSRLTVRVARALVERQAGVTVIRRGQEEAQLAGLLPKEALPVEMDPVGGEADAFRAAGLPEAACLLTLAESDLDNLRVAVASRAVAPDMPVVLRAFNPVLADQLEQGLNIRRAYNVSGLAAPAFVAAACGDEVLETLRLGDSEVPICRLAVRPGSPLTGKTIAENKARYGCAIVARCTGRVMALSPTEQDGA